MVGDLRQRDLEFGEALRIALAMFQERIGIIIGGTLFYTFVPLVVFIPAGITFMANAAAFTSPDKMDPGKMIPIFVTFGACAIVYMMVYYALRIGWTSICLKITKSEPAPFSEFFSNFGYLLNFVGVHILMGMVIGAGILLFIIPGIFLGIRLCFAPYLVLDQNMGPIEAMKASWGMVEGYAMKVFFAGLAYLVVSLVTNFIPFIGSIAQILALSYFDLILCTLYRSRKGDLVSER